MAIEDADRMSGNRARIPQIDVRRLPHNVDAEASILGGVILRNDLLGDLDMIETDMFYDPRHKVVWDAIRNLDALRRPIDVVTLETEIEKVGKLAAIDGIAFLGELTLRVPTADNVRAYARIVRDHHLVRSVALRASEVVERAYDWKYEADELLGEHLADLQRIETGYREASERLPIITIDDGLDELDRLARTPIYKTPFPELNRTLGFDGLLGGQVYYLCGGTGFGKTSWLTTVVKHHAAQGRPALIAFYEMFAAYYIARMAAPEIGVHANRIIRGEIDRAAVKASLPTSIELLDSPSMGTLQRAAERHVRAGRGAPLIVVDYIQLLGEKVMATMARPDARLANAQASGGLRELAKSTGAAVIVVSAAGRSASRELAKDVRKKPASELISSARETGSIEFDGAGMIVLSVSDELDGDERIATVSVAKARFGTTIHIDNRFTGSTGAWREIGVVARAVKLEPKPDDGSVRAVVRAVIAKFGPQRSKSEICRLTKTISADGTGKNKTAVLSEIDAMIKDQILVYADAEYRFTEAYSTPVPEPTQAELPVA